MRVLFYVALAMFGLAFIPSEKEISLPQHEISKSFKIVTSYKMKVYRTDTACLDKAIDESGWQRDVYDELAKNRKGIGTKDVAEIIKLSSGSCNERLDPDIHVKISDCEVAYLKNGKLYGRVKVLPKSGNEYGAVYEDPIDIKIVEGPSIAYETYHTKKCHAFGLICSSGEWLDDDTTFHERFVIGKNAKIKKYNTVCDLNDSKQKLEEENCVYADDTYKNVTINSLL